MLILTCKPGGDRLLIADDITITICAVDESRGIVTVGVDAPRGVTIDRENVRLAKERSGNIATQHAAFRGGANA